VVLRWGEEGEVVVERGFVVANQDYDDSRYQVQGESQGQGRAQLRAMIESGSW